jgi:hypothetical protein
MSNGASKLSTGARSAVHAEASRTVDAARELEWLVEDVDTPDAVFARAEVTSGDEGDYSQEANSMCVVGPGGTGAGLKRERDM